MSDDNSASFKIDVSIMNVDEAEMKSVAADLVELCLSLLEDGCKPHNIVAGALLASTLLGSDMGETYGPMQ